MPAIVLSRLLQLNTVRLQCRPDPSTISLSPGTRTTGSTTGSTLPTLSHTYRLRGSRILHRHRALLNRRTLLHWRALLTWRTRRSHLLIPLHIINRRPSWKFSLIKTTHLLNNIRTNNKLTTNTKTRINTRIMCRPTRLCPLSQTQLQINILLTQQLNLQLLLLQQLLLL